MFQLEGGIHRYLEHFDDGGSWLGKNFVFDRRLYQENPSKMPQDQQTVGCCYRCDAKYDQVRSTDICTVCLKWLLICEKCRPQTFYQYHCHRHLYLEQIFFTRLNGFTGEEITRQRDTLQVLVDKFAKEDKLNNAMKKGRRRRRLLQKQIRKINGELQRRAEEGFLVSDSIGKHQEFCRTCQEEQCNGDCWGFWAAERTTKSKGEVKAEQVGKARAARVETLK